MKVRQLLFLFMASLFLFPLAIGGEREKTLVEPPWNHCLGIDRVGQFLLGVYTGTRERFDDPRGIHCVKLISEDDTSSGRDDDELTVFGCDRGQNSIIFNRGMRSIGIAGAAGETRFSRPTDVAGSDSGDVFVADTGNDRIVRFRYEDGQLRLSRVYTGAGGVPFRGPEGIAYSGGAVWVADTGNDRVSVFLPDGTDIATIGPALDRGRLDGPTGIDVLSEGDPWVYYADYFAAVIDSSGRRLRLVAADGRVGAISMYGDLPRGDGRFEDLAIDYYGNVWVTDPPAGVLRKFDRHLGYIVAVGGSRKGRIHFDEPRGIAINRRFGQVFVSERGGARYRWIGVDVFDLRADGPAFAADSNRFAVNVSFLLTEHASIDCRVEDERGRLVATLLDGHLLPGGRFTRRIEANCASDGPRAKCMMRVVVEARPTYASAGFLVVERTAVVSETARGIGETLSEKAGCTSAAPR
ncbi:MAG: NHL repeat-containing protein [Candidatus Krumholzibacteriota bacterium]|nr:NHL repeat-containing protein [Candidatus Krumholzibacteriota bacterium]